MVGKQHSEDYKLSAVKYCLNSPNATYEDTARIFDCRVRSLKRWVERYQSNGELTRKDRQPGSYVVTVDQVKLIKKEISKDPDIMVNTIYTKLCKAFPENQVSRQHVNRIIRDNNITRKRATRSHFPKEFRGQPRDKEKEMKAFFDKVSQYSLNDIISIDETAIRPGMMPNYCRSTPFGGANGVYLTQTVMKFLRNIQ